MPLWPTTPRSLRTRIASCRRILRQEYDARGMWGDGYGKRLWLFPLYFLLRDDDEARSYIDWYATTFPNDIYEVSQCICWAFILHRLGREEEAVYRLVRGIEENLPAVAKVVGDYQGPYGIWGEEVMGLSDLDGQLIEAMTDDERRWLVASWRSPAVSDMRERCTALGRQLVTAPVGPGRSALLDEYRGLAQRFCPVKTVPLSADGGGSWLMAGRAVRGTGGRKVIRTSLEIWRQSGDDQR